jgi:molybdopterin/thiamine biosynthesis adenylyltransferase
MELITSSASVWRLRARTQLVPVAGALVARLGNRRLRFSPFGSPEERLLQLLADGVTEAALADIMSAWPDADRQRGELLFETLREHLFLEVRQEPNGIAPADIARFSRLTDLFSELEQQGEQSRYERLASVLNARVGVVGTGGMGSWILYGLACCGVGNLMIMDADVVEASNLNRSILFTEDHIGRAKVDAAAESLRRFAPRLSVTAVPGRVSGPADVAWMADDVDVVVGACDQPAWLVRQWLAEACRDAGTPLIHPSGLRVGPFFVPGKTACPMCEWAELVARNPHYADVVAHMRRLPRGNSGGVAPWAGITANVTVMEVFRYLSGFGSPTTYDTVWEMGADFTGRLRALPRQPDCVVCGDRSPC